jgi:hypothetical protein
LRVEVEAEKSGEKSEGRRERSEGSREKGERREPFYTLTISVLAMKQFSNETI